MSFLPSDYQFREKSGQFMRLKNGENRIRILSDAIVGYSWWDENKKPFRVRTFQEAVNNGVEPLKEFWAFVVWNYNSNQVEVLELTQKTIQRQLHTLNIDSDWGDPKQYDINIQRTGEGMETEYQVSPKPAKPLSNDIKLAYEGSDIDLQALFKGEYPMPVKNEGLEKMAVESLTKKDINDDIPF